MSRIIHCTQQDDVVGMKCGMLTFVRHLGAKNSEGRYLSEWMCECGNLASLPTGRVLSGVRVSCGCYHPKTNLIHGMKGSPTYSSWRAMKNRCCDPGNKDYPRWGAKGVTVCDRWLHFENFLADMGERPAGTSIDRYPDRHGNYEPSNCRWATASQQQQNKDNFVVVETPLGIMPIMEYAKLIGITNGAAHLRLKRGKLEGCRRANNQM